MCNVYNITIFQKKCWPNILILSYLLFTAVCIYSTAWMFTFFYRKKNNHIARLSTNVQAGDRVSGLDLSSCGWSPCDADLLGCGTAIPWCRSVSGLCCVEAGWYLFLWWVASDDCCSSGSCVAWLSCWGCPEASWLVSCGSSPMQTGSACRGFCVRTAVMRP